ncbi:MAG: DNA cytosine methyltransferase [Spirochaetales bacterium]|nr:DNA cytosine methyltransferase [Spirochaetales bacterium]
MRNQFEISKKLRFLDLFAGAGGLSEGFIQSGFSPIAHVERDKAACFTLKTRMAYHWLKNHNKLACYIDYLDNKITRHELYNLIPGNHTSSVISAEIGKKILNEIFQKVDNLLHGKRPDLIIGGPPCQAYSLVGRSRDKNRMRDDTRNHLYIYYVEFLKRYKPKYFVFENVTGLLSAKSPNGNHYFREMRALFLESGYETEYKVLSANEYGILQNRKRIILVGKRGRKTGFFPEPDKWNPEVKVCEIFDDLPAIRAGEGSIMPCKINEYSGKYLYKTGIRNDDVPVTWHCARPHNERDLEIYRIAVKKWNMKGQRLNYNDLPDRLKTHKNDKSFLDRFKVVSANLFYSHTVVAHISKDGHHYIHPDINQNRSLTPREAARLQTFPDDYFFESINGEPLRGPVYRQIGNAVPVLLSRKIAEKLLEGW